MMSKESFSALIGRIYDCALDPALWTDALAEITDVLRGEMADLGVQDPLAGTHVLAADYGWPEDLKQRVMANQHLNPGASLGLIVPLCEPICTTRDLDIDAFHSSSYWNACFAGLDYYDYVTAAISRTATSFAWWGVLGSKERGAYSDDDLAFARLISPHIRRSVEISGLLSHKEVERGTLRSALDALAAAAFIVEPTGKLLFCNGSGNDELRSQRVFRDSQGRLIGTTPEAMAFVAHLQSGTRAPHASGYDTRLVTARGTLHATWVLLEQAGQELGSPILVLVRDPEADLRTPLIAAASVYGLSAGEAQVLAQVLNGHTLAEAAALLGVARATVKTQLDAVFRKTGTRRQSELVRQVLNLTSPLQSPDGRKVG